MNQAIAEASNVDYQRFPRLQPHRACEEIDKPCKVEIKGLEVLLYIS